MAKFLITGAKGQVGYCLTHQLQGKHEILAVDRDELDITDKSAVKNAWALNAKESAIIVLDKNGKVKFVKEGQLSASDIQTVLSLVREFTH